MTLTGGEGKLMYIDHAPGVGFAQDLRAGFTEVVEGEPGLDLLPIQYFDLEPQKANTITRTTITRHPDLAGAFVGVGVRQPGRHARRSSRRASSTRSRRWPSTPSCRT